MKLSIDQLVDKLERQVKRYRERRVVEPRRHMDKGELTATPFRFFRSRAPLHRILAERVA